MAGKMDECIASLKGQTFTDFEAIFVDDGSTDNTCEELEKLVSEDSRIRLYKHDENRSLQSARYTAMQHAKGDLIVFLDSDDHLSFDALESIAESMKEDPVDVLRFGYVIDPEGSEHFPPASDDPLKSILEGSIPPGIWKNAYNRRVIDKAIKCIKPFYCNMGEDSFYAGVFFSCAETFGTLDKILYHYMVIGDGMSNTKADIPREKVERNLKSVAASGDNLLTFMKEYYPGNVPLTETMARTMKRFLMLQNTVYEPDYVKIIDRFSVFDREGTRDIYEWGCRKYLPFLIEQRLKADSADPAEEERLYRKLLTED